MIEGRVERLYVVDIAGVVNILNGGLKILHRAWVGRKGNWVEQKEV